MKKDDGAITLNLQKLQATIEKEITRQAANRGQPVFLLPRQLDALKSDAASIVKEFRQGYKPSVPGVGLQQWLESDDTGAASLYMAHILFGAPKVEYAFPKDNTDFDNCVKLWEARSPSEAAQITELMAATGKEWKAIIHQWEPLLALHKAGSWAQLDRKLHLIANAK